MSGDPMVITTLSTQRLRTSVVRVAGEPPALLISDDDVAFEISAADGMLAAAVEQLTHLASTALALAVELRGDPGALR